MVWGALLDTISQSPRAKTAELRLGVALAEHRLESLLPFFRPLDDKESRMRTMGALLLIDYWLVGGIDFRQVSCLLVGQQVAGLHLHRVVFVAGRWKFDCR